MSLQETKIENVDVDLCHFLCMDEDIEFVQKEVVGTIGGLLRYSQYIIILKETIPSL